MLIPEWKIFYIFTSKIRNDMKFRTELEIGKSSVGLSPERPVVLLGSCFAANIAERMRRGLWNACNPLGTLYNPLSIERSLRMVLSVEESVLEESLFSGGGAWRSWLADSSMSAETVEDVAADFRRRAAMLEDMLRQGERLFVTFGTAWCYYLKEREGYVVANCHKQPASLFERRRAGIGEIADIWKALIKDLRDRFPGLEIFFTVSPVRHLKDGFEGNAVSKAILRIAVEEICRNNDHCHYFPAYEIMNDDLRDYRFYASDLVHPSEEATEYIWEKFRETYLDVAGEALLREGEKLWKALHHRPLPNATRHPSESMLRGEELRRSELERRLREFHDHHPGMLGLHH